MTPKKRLTPKERVRKQYPEAYSRKTIYKMPQMRWSIQNPLSEMGFHYLGFGKTPQLAWKNAFENL